MRIHDAYRKNVDPTDSTQGAGKGQAVSKEAEARHAKEAQSHEHRDSIKVNVSAKAKELAADQSAEAAKVDRLRNEIKNGTFKVDARAIAKKIVDGDGDGDGTA